MTTLTDNEKAITSNKFPKIMTLKQYNKNQPIEELNTHLTGSDLKALKILVNRKDFILGEDTTLINIATIANPETHDLDKARLIKLTRLACDLNPKIAFYGWNTLMLRLNVQYGSHDCLRLAETLKRFVMKHCEAYTEHFHMRYKEEWVNPSEELLKQRYDYILCKNPESPTSKLDMWTMVDGVYCIHDDFYQALLDYGYTKDQLRGVIHRCTHTKTYDLIPRYLRKKYLAIPDGNTNLSKILEN